MADVFPPIHLYAVLAASIGLLAAGKDGARLRTKFPRNLWLCLPALAAGLHLVGYILIDIFNEQSSKLTPGQAWTLQFMRWCFLCSCFLRYMNSSELRRAPVL